MNIPGQQILKYFRDRISNSTNQRFSWGDYSDSADSWLDSSASNFPDAKVKCEDIPNQYSDYGDYADHGWGDHADSE